MANKYLLKIIDILEVVERRGSTTDVQNLKFNTKDEISKYGKYKKEILQWIARTELNFYRFFLPLYYSKIGKNELGLFLDYDLIAKDWIKTKTVSSLIPLSTGLLLLEEAETMIKWLKHSPIIVVLVNIAMNLCYLVLGFMQNILVPLPIGVDQFG